MAMGMGFTESIIALLVLLGGFGLPLGVPPEPENPAMQQVAPAECLFYATWSSMAAPNPQSTNHTEQMLAEPEVQEFAAEIERAIGRALKQASVETDDPKAQQLIQLGPVWAKTLVTRSTAIFLSRLEVGREKVDFEVGILIDAAGEAKAIAAGLVDVLSSEDLRFQEVTVGTFKMHRIAIAEGPVDTEVTIGAAGPYVLIGVGKGSVEGMVERLKAKQVPAWLSAISERLPVERRASLSYINAPKLVETLLPLAGPEVGPIAEELGLTQLGEIQMVTGLDKEGMVSRTFMGIDGAPRGLMKLFDGDGITAEKLSFIPKDSTFAAAFSLNALRLYHLAEQIAEMTPQGAGGLDELEQVFRENFGVGLKGELLPALGDVWTLSASPADGWMGFVATVEVRDAGTLATLHKRIAAMLNDSPPEQKLPRILARQHGPNVIGVLVHPNMPLMPAWCVTEGRLMVALSPQAIKSHLGTTPEERGLFAGDAFRQTFAGEGKILAISHQDSSRMFEGIYSYVNLLGPMMMTAIHEATHDRFGPENAAPPIFDFSTFPSGRSIYRHLKPGVTVTRRTAAGIETQSRQTLPMPNVGASAPVAVALLLPAVQAAREAARRMQSSNNLKQIALAMHNHADTFRNLPPAYSTDKDGKPLLSWRVHILPFIEQQVLYDQFHLDEPWDSEHNRKLIDKMPEVYRSPNSAAAPGKTVYLAISGKEGIFAPPAKASDGRTGGVRFADVRDGTSNTIAVVEANDESAVEWTKPVDITPDAMNPLKGIVGMRPGIFMAAFTDGSVRAISDQIPPKTVMNLFQRNDGNPIDYSELERD